jgi:hypothetical protein
MGRRRWSHSTTCEGGPFNLLASGDGARMVTHRGPRWPSACSRWWQVAWVRARPNVTVATLVIAWDKPAVQPWSAFRARSQLHYIAVYAAGTMSLGTDLRPSTRWSRTSWSGTSGSYQQRNGLLRP